MWAWGFHQFIMMYIVCAVNSPKIIFKSEQKLNTNAITSIWQSIFSNGIPKCRHTVSQKHTYTRNSHEVIAPISLYPIQIKWNMQIDEMKTHTLQSHSLPFYATNENFVRMTNCFDGKNNAKLCTNMKICKIESMY